MLVPAYKSHATISSGEWVFVDIGFSRDARSCGVAIGDDRPTEMKFAELAPLILEVVRAGTGPMNLLVEAPMSVAFTPTGNPTGRRLERRGARTRYWYAGLGCAVLIAATYLMRQLYEYGSEREIRLFEGFVSFKEKGTKSSHSKDVADLRSVAWNLGQVPGAVVGPEDLKMNAQDRLCSAFAVSGMDLGVPPVVVVGNDF